ncbi:hypothetical protein [Desulfuribacillus alkaliarsenatis]|nr:hypothetical protein [Desulfuribacillus alkaliarsenatis]
MKSLFKSSYFFWVFLALYLFLREWPTGGAGQTMMDIVVLVLIIMTVFQMVMKSKGADE